MADSVLTPGNKVAKLGEFFHLTQEVWADELGISRGTVAAYKHRKNASPSTEKLRGISIKYGIPIVWFYDGLETDPPIAPEIGTARAAAADGNIIAVHPSKLSPDVARFARDVEVILPVWRGIAAGLDECHFTDDQLETPQAVPSFFVSNRDPSEFVVCLPAGVSMAPRIIQGDRVVVRLHSHPDPGDIIVARRPDGVNFIKVFRIGTRGPELHSINENFPIIFPEDDWMARAVAVGIYKPYLRGGTNIEYNGGSTLKG